jgi:hypothetical protein
MNLKSRKPVGFSGWVDEGTGMGWEIPTLGVPVPVTAGWWVGRPLADPTGPPIIPIKAVYKFGQKLAKNWPEARFGFGQILPATGEARMRSSDKNPLEAIQEGGPQRAQEVPDNGVVMHNYMLRDVPALIRADY